VKAVWIAWEISFIAIRHWLNLGLSAYRDKRRVPEDHSV
jgi:hypothetical protein